MSIPSLKRDRDIIRSVSVRTRDDVAVLQDLPKGRTQISHAFPIIPTFDALSYFTLTGIAKPHDSLEAYVHDVTPLHYEDPKAGQTADVVVIRLRAYRATYAPDSSDTADGRTHIKLDPYEFVTAQSRGDALFFSDLVYDNSTKLPVHVGFVGPDDRAFSVDYTTVDGHWVLERTHYEETIFAPLRVGRVHYTIDATFSDYSFPATAPDPQLAQ